MKKLSIITINYNDADGLKKTIESVINQSFKDFEYIVIDGNSSDSSKEVLEEFKDKIDIAISEPDSGIYNAMNKGASFASGQYLLFLNSGDKLHNNEVLEELFSLDPSADIVSSRCLDYDKKRIYIKIPPKYISLYTFRRGSIPHPSSIIKTEIFNKVGGFIEKYRIMSDWCFFIDALIINRCTYETTKIILTDFNRYGISSTQGSSELDDTTLFLKQRFGSILNDYGNLEDEALFNVCYWISSSKGLKKKFLYFPYKVINRIFNLRNNLNKMIGVKRIK